MLQKSYYKGSQKLVANMSDLRYLGVRITNESYVQEVGNTVEAANYNRG
jgi:hypothetical protein